MSVEQQENFLANAEIATRKQSEVGLTKSEVVELSDGRRRHKAHLQQIDVYDPLFKGKNGTTEKNFRDTYKFNIAAYRLAKLLNLTSMVPPSVYREVDGKGGAMTWWIDNIQMDEKTRRDKKIPVPADQAWINQLNTVRVFDQLIYNTDRNQENLLITNDWKVWMIDHTRAFRAAPTLMNPKALTRIDYRLMRRLKSLTREEVQRELGRWIYPEELDGLMARRDVIVKFFESEISTKGDVSVLTDLPRSTPQVTIP